jgi:hypothetical protein
MKIQLIDDWKNAWKYLSVQIATLLTILGVAYEFLPILREHLPAQVFQYAAGVIVVSRIIKQGSLQAKSENQNENQQ